MAHDPFTVRLSDLQSISDVDQTLRNLLNALSLNLDLRARYRVFEFEARQDARHESAKVFDRLVEAEALQIEELLAELRRQLATGDSQ